MKSSETPENFHETDRDYAISKKVAAVIMEVSTTPNFLRKVSHNSNLLKLKDDKGHVSSLKQEETFSAFKEDLTKLQDSELSNKDIDALNGNIILEESKKANASSKFYKIYNVLKLVTQFTTRLNKKERGNENKQSNLNYFGNLHDIVYFSQKSAKFHFCEFMHEIWKDVQTRKLLNLFMKYISKLVSFDYLLITLIVFNFLMIPILEAFKFDELEKNIWFFQALCTFFLLFLYQIIRNFKSHHFITGIEVGSNDISMISHMMSSQFFYDVCCCFYFLVKIVEIHFESRGITITKSIASLLFIFSLNTLKIKLSKLMYNFTIKSQNVLPFVDLFSNSILFVHYVSCVLILIGRLQFEEETGWLFKFSHSDEKSKLEVYISAFYYIFFGNYEIFHKTLVEKVYFSTIYFLMIIFIVVNFHNIREVWDCMIYRFSKESKKKIDIFRDYLSDKNVVYNNMLKIEKYLQFVNKPELEQNFVFIQDQLKILPDSLKEDLFKNLKIFITKKIPVFKCFSSLCIGELLNELQQRTYKKDEVIFDCQNSEEPYLYIIEKGQVNICFGNLKKSPIILQKINENEIFGDFTLFGNTQIKYSIISATDTIVKCLNKDSLLEVLKMNPIDYEKYCNIKDEFIVNRSYEKFDRQCAICKQKTHHSLDCLSCLLQNIKKQMLQARVASHNQTRKFLVRSKKAKNFNALMKKEIISKALTQWSSNSNSQSSVFSSEDLDENSQEIEASEFSSKQSENSEIVSEQRSSEGSVSLVIEKQRSTNITNNSAKKSVFFHLNQNLKDKEAGKVVLKRESYEESSEEKEYGDIIMSEKKEFEILNVSPFIKYNIPFELDQMHEFRYYFIHGNISQIVNRKIINSNENDNNNEKMRVFRNEKNRKNKQIKMKTMGNIFINLRNHLKKKVICLNK